MTFICCNIFSHSWNCAKFEQHFVFIGKWCPKTGARIKTFPLKEPCEERWRNTNTKDFSFIFFRVFVTKVEKKAGFMTWHVLLLHEEKNWFQGKCSMFAICINLPDSFPSSKDERGLSGWKFLKGKSLMGTEIVLVETTFIAGFFFFHVSDIKDNLFLVTIWFCIYWFIIGLKVWNASLLLFFR